MQIWGTGIDEIRFQTVPGVELCINTEIPAGAAVYVGKDRIPVTPPYDLEAMGVCDDGSCH
jgi:hypothetical protein